MTISDRKKRILAAVIDEYIRTAEPVGSKTIAEHAGLGCSSATIRNELAELAAMGYLEQPHTSAGRIPTALGYRIYVNELMEQQKLILKLANGKEEYGTVADEIYRLRAEKQQILMDTAGRENARKRVDELLKFLDGEATELTEYNE